MSSTASKLLKRFVWITILLVGVLVLYALSLGPVVRIYDTANAPGGYQSLPAAVRLCYYPLQRVPWPVIYQQYLRAMTETPRKPYVPTEAERAAWPKTVNEAVTNILASMADADKVQLRDTKKQDLIQFHHDWGMGIRNEFGLWKGNTNLMSDCRAQHPDDASMVIIEAVWERLQKP